MSNLITGELLPDVPIDRLSQDLFIDSINTFEPGLQEDTSGHRINSFRSALQAQQGRLIIHLERTQQFELKSHTRIVDISDDDDQPIFLPNRDIQTTVEPICSTTYRLQQHDHFQHDGHDKKVVSSYELSDENGVREAQASRRLFKHDVRTGRWLIDPEVPQIVGAEFTEADLDDALRVLVALRNALQADESATRTLKGLFGNLMQKVEA